MAKVSVKKTSLVGGNDEYEEAQHGSLDIPKHLASKLSVGKKHKFMVHGEVTSIRGPEYGRKRHSVSLKIHKVRPIKNVKTPQMDGKSMMSKMAAGKMGK